MTWGFVDIHCHILPGVDDGAASLAEALEMAAMASADGIATIIATPHANEEYPARPAEEWLRRVAALQEEIECAAVPLRILPGADVQITESLPAKVRERRVLTLADTGRYLLLELPHDIYVPIDDLMDELKRMGVRSILSHPERNRGILADLSLLRPLVARGCLLQVTAGSILGEFGREARAAAIELLQDRLVHFVATDAHSPRRRKPLLRAAYDAVAALTDPGYAEQIFCSFPAAVVEGRPIVAPCPAASRRSLFARLFG